MDNEKDIHKSKCECTLCNNDIWKNKEVREIINKFLPNLSDLLNKIEEEKIDK